MSPLLLDLDPLFSSWPHLGTIVLFSSVVSKFNLKHFGVKGIFVREDLSPEARQQRKKDFASRRSTSGSQLSLSKPADVGHSTVPDDSSLR